MIETNDEAIAPEDPPQVHSSDQEHPPPGQLEAPEPSAAEPMSAEELVSAAQAEVEDGVGPKLTNVNVSY